MYANGGGKVSVCFNVYGTGTMDDIGALTVQLQESTDGGSTFTTIKRYSYMNYSTMLKHGCMVAYESNSVNIVFAI